MQNTFNLAKLNLYSLNNNFPILPPPQSLVTIILLSVSMYWTTLGISSVESYNIWPFVTGLFHLAKCLQCSLMLQYVRISFLLRLNYFCMYMPHFVYPFICGWTLGLLLPFGFGEYCYDYGLSLSGCTLLSIQK